MVAVACRYCRSYVFPLWFHSSHLFYCSSKQQTIITADFSRKIIPLFGVNENYLQALLSFPLQIFQFLRHKWNLALFLFECWEKCGKYAKYNKNKKNVCCIKAKLRMICFTSFLSSYRSKRSCYQVNGLATRVKRTFQPDKSKEFFSFTRICLYDLGLLAVSHFPFRSKKNHKKTVLITFSTFSKLSLMFFVTSMT